MSNYKIEEMNRLFFERIKDFLTDKLIMDCNFDSSRSNPDTYYIKITVRKIKRKNHDWIKTS